MARTKTNTAVDNVATADDSAVASVVDAEKNMNEKIVEKTPVKEVEKVEPLRDSNEIKVVSLVPNVWYHNDYTGQNIEWKYVGQEEFMTFEELKAMWRESKGYFRNMWLKPEDDRVIAKFSLTNIYKKYDFLMDEKNYTRANIDKLCESISSASSELKYCVCDKVKNLVAEEKITDIHVIRALEKHLKVDLTSFI